MLCDLKIQSTVHTGTDRDRLHNPQDVSALKSLINYLGSLLGVSGDCISHVSSTRLFRSLELNGHFTQRILSQFEPSFETKP